MGDNPQDRPYAKREGITSKQIGQTRYAKAFPVVSQENMRHDVLPRAAALAAAELSRRKANGTVSKANSRATYLSLLHQFFIQEKRANQNVISVETTPTV